MNLTFTFGVAVLSEMPGCVYYLHTCLSWVFSWLRNTAIAAMGASTRLNIVASYTQLPKSESIRASVANTAFAGLSLFLFALNEIRSCFYYIINMDTLA